MRVERAPTLGEVANYLYFVRYGAVWSSLAPRAVSATAAERASAITVP